VCFAQAAYHMQPSAREDSKHHQIFHSDIKPENILTRSLLHDDDHKNVAAMKVSLYYVDICVLHCCAKFLIACRFRFSQEDTQKTR
jgi:serine/threonine protein kinase